jgi:hypothetical protein
MEKVYALSNAQIKKLIRRHGKQLSGTVNKDKLVYIVLPDDVNAPVDVQDTLGNSLGNISFKEAWAL